MSPSDDDDSERTVIRPRSQRSAAAPLGHTLPVGTRLRDYEISGLIGEGGFGIVYLAWDHSLQRKVAIKEYMPASMASRVAGSSAIVVKSERHLDTFKAGLRSFVNEARLLARFDHASLVKVYRFWEENGTAYMAMPFYEGPTLKSALAELGHAPSEAELRAWLDPLLDALAVMHAAQCFHRDIAPDNILLTATGPLLLDFGAARRVIGDMTHALTVVLKPGYAPIEQYGDVASMSQGAWTDLYALACVVYYAITGKTPMSSVERLMDDRLSPLAVEAAGRYGDGFLRAIDAALAVRPQDRPQNEAQFRALLNLGLPPPAPEARASGYGTLSHSVFPETEERYGTVPGTLTPELATELHARPAEAPPDADSGVAAPKPAPTSTPASGPTAAATASPAGPATVTQPNAGPDTTPFVTPTVATVPPAAPASGRRGLAIGAGFVVAALVLGAAVYWFALPVKPDGAAARRDAPSAASAAAAVLPAASTRVSGAAPPASLPPTATTNEPAVPPPTATTAEPRVTAPVAAPQAVTPRDDLAPQVVAPPIVKTPVTPAVVPPVVAPKPRREPAPVETPAETRPAPARRATGGARCSDILQKASLEPLTAEEADYLKRECR